MSLRGSLFALLLVASGALAREKPTLAYKARPSGGEDRPVITEVVLGPQGSDYAFKIEFDKEPWGETCGARCANATLFLDTDNNKATGLKLKDAKAAETGADLAITIQGVRGLKDGRADSALKVKVVQYAEDATAVEQGAQLVELDQKRDPERMVAQGTSVYLLIDANIGNLPSGAKMRLVYHPPESKPLVGMALGLSAAGAGRIEIFKDGKITNPPAPTRKKKSDYEPY